MRVAIVNDSLLAIEALRRTLSCVPEYEIPWVALDGAEAVQKSAADTPDLILMDLMMPVMDGVEATRRIMARTPCPILVVTATVLGHAGRVVEALGAGALDAVITPELRRNGANGGAQDLLVKIANIARMLSAHCPKTYPRPAIQERHPASSQPDHLIAIGSSSGGPAALATILSALPKDFPAAIVIVQHVDAQFASTMAKWLDEISNLPVRLAIEGDRLRNGRVLVAGTGNHLVLRAGYTLSYTTEPSDYPYRPSVNAFFDSMVTHWRGHMSGVLLTGMGRDGAAGLKRLRDNGAFTIAQDSRSCAVYGMPKAAAELNAATEILPLEEIANALTRHVMTTTEKMR